MLPASSSSFPLPPKFSVYTEKRDSEKGSERTWQPVVHFSHHPSTTTTGKRHQEEGSVQEVLRFIQEVIGSRPTNKAETASMFLKVQLPWNVIIPAESLDTKGLMLQKSIIIRLLDDFSSKKATKDLGYFLAVTTLDHIGEGKVRQHTGDVLFPVLFSCVTFKPLRGEILEGVVHKILKHGVFLRSGPIENLYLSNQKMSDYKYVPGENPIFMNDKLSKIEKDVVVRFSVIGTKYIEVEREYQAVVSLEGDFLGPVS